MNTIESQYTKIILRENLKEDFNKRKENLDDTSIAVIEEFLSNESQEFVTVCTDDLNIIKDLNSLELECLNIPVIIEDLELNLPEELFQDALVQLTKAHLMEFMKPHSSPFYEELMDGLGKDTCLVCEYIRARSEQEFEDLENDVFTILSELFYLLHDRCFENQGGYFQTQDAVLDYDFHIIY
ncbi:hypothetical protein H5404_18110 [Vibrio parahaemolyticus]|uniref:hypothetical protein n=1 Tax=Vibrio parahaemolyticus TaxID=670 RepID=UPI0016295767|nr:hypothetical protein [Vibrio parahaemolyticus]QNE57737.1 hypothetical protein H5404_18110 [Vibrio parahaemolyticus]